MARIRVVHIITRLILGGAQENTLLTVEGLDKKKEYNVTLVTGPAIGPEGELISRARASGVDLVLVDEMRREIHPWRDWVSLVKLCIILRRKRPHIVHTHSSKAGVLGRIAARMVGVPIVVHTIHGLPFHPYQKKIWNDIFTLCEKVCSRMTDVIVTVADAMTVKAVAAGVAGERKFRTIYSGFELEPYAAAADLQVCAREELGIPADALVVGKIARLAPLKGHEFLMKAASQIVKEVPSARFLLVGDGTLREELEKDAATLGLRDRFIFTGMVDRKRVPLYLAAMDVVVHTSLREGLARVLPQALVAGKPVVSYDIDGAAEVVDNGRTGYLLQPGDVLGLAERVIKLLKNKGLRNGVPEEDRQMAKDRFSVELMVDRIDRLYKELLNVGV